MTSPLIVSLALIWLIVLLIVGTIAQKYTGLWLAQQKYFASFVFWFGFLPLPGSQSALALITIGIIAKLTQSYMWRRDKLGSAIIHGGVLFLLLGSFLVGHNKLEGGIVLDQGQDKNYVEDYHLAELVITEISEATDTGNEPDATEENPNTASTNSEEEQKINPDINQETLQIIGEEFAFGAEELRNAAKSGSPLPQEGLPFAIRPSKFFTNIDLVRLAADDEQANSASYKGFAKIFRLMEKKSELKSEENLSGINFNLLGKDGKVIGNYAVFEQMPIVQTISYADKKYSAVMRPLRYYLPFNLRLLDFEAEYHPASQVARSYKSILRISGDGIEQRAQISMNRPLRYRDWTIYQSAFSETQGRETSILAAVRNSARLVPYIAGLIIILGLLLHLFLRLPKLKT